MQNSTKTTELNTEPTNQIPKPTGMINVPSGDSDNTDDFGYENDIPAPKETDGEIPPPAGTDAPKKTESDIPAPTKKLSGYGDEEPTEADKPKVVEPPKEVPPPTTDEEKVKLEIQQTIDSLPANVNKEKVSKFVTDNNFSKDQVTAYAKLVKDESEAMAAEQAKQIKETRAKWKQELTTDPEFGGENYAKNVDRVEKVLEEYMVNTKKVLTERGGVLPPSTMKDLLAISKALNPTAPLVVGEAPGEAEGGKSFLDDLYQ